MLAAGADDVGQLMQDEWFDAGVAFALRALEDHPENEEPTDS
jgi:hypothetical protein